MSWINDVQYKKSSVCECGDGIHGVRIVDIRTEDYGHKRGLAFFLEVDSPDWNRVPYKHLIFEGDSFDSQFSRTCDAFGVDFESHAAQLRNGDWQPFADSPLGQAEFTHTRRKQVAKGFDPSGKPLIEWVTERSDFVQARLVKKAAPPPHEPFGARAGASGKGGAQTSPFSEDIPF